MGTKKVRPKNANLLTPVDTSSDDPKDRYLDQNVGLNRRERRLRKIKASPQRISIPLRPFMKKGTQQDE